MLAVCVLCPCSSLIAARQALLFNCACSVPATRTASRRGLPGAHAQLKEPTSKRKSQSSFSPCFPPSLNAAAPAAATSVLAAPAAMGRLLPLDLARMLPALPPALDRGHIGAREPFKREPLKTKQNQGPEKKKSGEGLNVKIGVSIARMRANFCRKVNSQVGGWGRTGVRALGCTCMGLATANSHRGSKASVRQWRYPSRRTHSGVTGVAVRASSLWSEGGEVGKGGQGTLRKAQVNMRLCEAALPSA